MSRADAPVHTGRLLQLAEDVWRLTAPNPGMMTGPGTNTYLVGTGPLAVIDPGPVIDEHLAQLAAAGDIRWILATHTHPDHSPGAARLAEMTGALLVGRPAPDGPHQDRTFAPSVVPDDGDRVGDPAAGLRALHTPGHASNHLCFLHESRRWLFTGDHVMNGSTVVIDPPDGDMNDYLVSLARLRALPLHAIAPGHGPLFFNPVDVIDGIVRHRLAREEKVRKALAAAPGSTSSALVSSVYREVDRSLHGLAERSLLAHLIKLEKDGVAACDGGRWSPAES
jgi:glyoxylase-like metal-dependent hydrolase (beta-lactamase superfamily II)